MARSQIDAIYTDLMSAFNQINHDIILVKLSRLGFHNNLVMWLKSYLNQRSYCVKINRCLSNVFVSSSGVPQGSNIGPVLFVLFINDLLLALPNHCLLMYADNIKMYAIIRNNSYCSTLQHSLDKFSNWCSACSLSLCVNKCCVYSQKRPN